MPACTKQDEDLFQATVANAFFASSLARTIKPVWVDELPPLVNRLPTSAFGDRTEITEQHDHEGEGKGKGKDKGENASVNEPKSQSGVRRLSDQGWKIVFQAVVEKDWCNYFGAMHGAAAAWVVDTCTSAALVYLSGKGFWEAPMLAGVTLALNMTYYHPAHIGTKMRVSIVIERLSLTLANMKCDLTDWDSGKPYASGTHLKTWKPTKSKL